LDLLRKEWAGRKAASVVRRALTVMEKEVINNTGIKDLKTAIKNQEKVRAEAAEETDYNPKYFKPQHTEYDDYSFDLV
jgi:hypothetical protein